MILCFHRGHLKAKHPDNYKQYLTCKSTALVSPPGISGFFQVRIAAISLFKKLPFACILLFCNVILLLVFLYMLHTERKIFYLLSCLLVCLFTDVLVLVLSLITACLAPITAGTIVSKLCIKTRLNLTERRSWI